MKKLLNCLSIIAFVLFKPLVSNSQTIQYSPLRCSGQIPNDFLSLSSEKIEKEKENIRKRELSNNNETIEKDFSYKTTFSLDDILFSGKVLYGDVLSNYVNSIADIVLNSDKELRSKLRFYVLKSTNVNAFSTHQGIIFVTVGLLSQVENEAQLAFILSHEIAHYKLNHTLKSYKINQQVKNGKGKFSDFSLDEKVKEIFNYSKENELEADKEGYNIYVKTKYADQAVVSSFDMLLYSYLAYDEIEWTPQVLQDSFYKFPTMLKLKKKSNINADEDEDDEESTHPNIKKRKESIEEIIENSGNSSDTSNYIIGETQFKFIQKQARTELFYILINYSNYKHLYYYSYLYAENYKEDSLFCNHLAAFSFYGLALKSYMSEIEYSPKDYDDYKIINNESEYEGAFNTVNTFFDELKSNELAILSTRVAWKNYINNYNDQYAKELFYKSIYFLFRYSDFNTTYFKNKDTVMLAKKEETKASNGKLTKSQKLKLKQKKQEEESSEDGNMEDSKKSNLAYYKKAFIINLENTIFKQAFDSISKAAIKERDEAENEESVYIYKGYRKYRTKYGNTLGVDSLILLNPGYSTYNYRKNKYSTNELQNESNELFLSKTYREMANANDIHLEEIDMLNRQQLTTEKINEYSQIIEWINERINNNYNNSILYNKKYISSITEKRNCKNLMLSGITYTTEKRSVDGTVVLLSALFWPTLPITLAYYLGKTKDVKIITIVYDLETGNLKYLNQNEMKFIPKKRMIKNQIFALFHELKTKNY